MRTEVCTEERAVWKAVREHHWNESLETHIQKCSICREIVQTTSWMQTFAQPAGSHLTLPYPDLLWRQSRLSEKHAELERALRPLQAMEVLPGAISVLIVGSWFLWTLSREGLSGDPAQMITQIWRIALTAETMMPAISSSGILLIAAVILSLGAIFATSPPLAKE